MVKLQIACALLALACAACKDAAPPEYSGMDVLSGQRIRVRPGALPRGASFQGCYASPQLGELVLFERGGSQLLGRYAYARGACKVSGELRGTRDGNLARYQFWETTEACPSWQPLHGEGYLLYAPSLVAGQPVQLLGRHDYWRLRPVSRDKAMREPHDGRRVNALRRSACAEPQASAAAGARP